MKRGNLFNQNLKRIGSSPILSTLLGILLPVVVVVVLVYIFFDQIKGWFSSLFGIDNSSTDADHISSLVDQLYLSMESYGTDEDSIYNILNTIDKKTFKLVYEAFGKRAYDPMFGTSGMIKGLYNNYDLVFWFKSELSYDDYVKYKTKFQQPGIIFS